MAQLGAQVLNSKQCVSGVNMCESAEQLTIDSFMYPFGFNCEGLCTLQLQRQAGFHRSLCQNVPGCTA